MLQLPDIFDAQNYARVRSALPEAQTMPHWCYTSPEWHRREIDAIFRPAWHFVGLASMLPSRGSFLTAETLGQPVLLVRSDQGIRAFRNSCRHRGSILLEEAQGTCGGIRCQYHSWVYSLEGKLLRAPGTEESSTFDPERHALTDVRWAELEGLLFVTLDENAPPVDQYFGDFAERVARPYRIAEMACVHRRSYHLASNWKLYVEVDMETLHTKHIHRGSIGEQPVVSPPTSGEWITVFHESDHTPALAPGERHLGFPATPGISGAANRGTHFSVLAPGFFLVTAPDCMWWIQKYPETPTRTRVDVGYCFPRASLDRPDYAEVSARYIRRWDQVVREDDWITEFQQRGLPGSTPGCYTPEEHVVHRLDNWILDRVLGAAGDRTPSAQGVSG
ncbi:aromatic ring-hydroxylating oxygenase subunit alpha [Amycolatopsis rubida]|uniref:Rieske 2Fe-2S family protein n=1 Tax=Amycolatopsis rubida TaxID=112413 RepID=A0A1I5S6R5_9PSEU|nr:aromatic ring-hydroxylating dioxygenase subunit alpha [Amycolatopsis rubida]SFP66399.1 Rieske 2Fe-2S family protein [Amycolatopsis rubida]